MKRKDLDRLEEIKDSIYNLLDEAKDLLARNAPPTVYQQAKSWMADIEGAVDEAHSSMIPVSMGDTIAVLEKEVLSEDPDTDGDYHGDENE